MAEIYSVEDCKVIELPIVHNEAGNITVLENGNNIPFDVNRVYYLYDVPMGSERGGHAHYELQQYVIAASGSFKFVLDDGQNKKEVFLNHPNKALHIKPGIWREMRDFSSGSVCVVLASLRYMESDYIRDYDQYLRYIMNRKELELVPYDRLFLEKSWEWLNDPEVKYLTDTSDFTKENQEKWYLSLKKKEDYLVWGVMLNKVPIGVFGIKNIKEQVGEYWGYIGNKNYWGKGLGKEVMRLLIERAKSVGLTGLYLKVIPTNLRAIKLYEKVGFVMESSSTGIVYMKKCL